ncbi:MAG: hypothetical protein ACLFUT_13380 [Desulfobacteraceae bacterium]
MARTRALREVAKDPLAKKEAVPLKTESPRHGIGHYTLTIALGLVSGLVGGILAHRFLRWL